MIVSRKTGNAFWGNLGGVSLRLSGPYYKNDYLINNSWHRLYGRSIWKAWDLNNKSFYRFKEVNYDC